MFIFKSALMYYLAKIYCEKAQVLLGKIIV